MAGLGVIAVVAVAFGYSELSRSSPEQQISSERSVTATDAKPKAKTRGLSYELTQQETSTICEKPSGEVCDVDPGPVNSRCECEDGSVGRIVR